MGNEMLCPCTSRLSFENEKSKDDMLIDQIIATRFNREDLLFSSEYETTKICIIESEKLDGFLKNKNNLRHALRRELNVFYNNVNITNCISNNDLLLVILEYIYDNKKQPTEESFEDKILSKGKRIGVSDAIVNYRVSNFTLITNETDKIVELIKMNINNMLKSDFLFIGVTNSSKENLREYKLIFKKIMKFNNEVMYEIVVYDGILNHSNIEKIVRENNEKVLKSVLIYYKNKDKKGKIFFFIFEKKQSEIKGYDNLVVEMKRKQMPDSLYYSDLAMKLSNLNKDIYNYKLTCLINDEDSIYFILNEESEEIETPGP